MAVDIEKLSNDICENLGKENIEKVYNCMTRVRVILRKKDEKLLENIKKIEGVMGVHDTDEELQIIVGPGAAAKVAARINELTQNNSAKKEVFDGEKLHNEIREKNNTPLKNFFKTIASIFIPLIPGFIACGLLTGVLGVSAKIYPDIVNNNIWQLLAAAGNSVFWGMNLFIGYNASKVFGGTPILGGALAAFITHPALKTIVLFDENLVPGRGGVIAVIMIAYFAAKIEKYLHKVVPNTFDLFVTPFCAFVISGIVAILALQPLGGVISNAIGSFATFAVSSGGVWVGFILAGIWLPSVMLGLHQIMTPIHVDLIATYGVTVLLPILSMAGAGQVGASFAVYIKTKNKTLKNTIASALPVGLMGVGEPLIYGVTLPLGKPFVTACVGASFGGAFIAKFAVGATTIGISGLPLAGATDNILIYVTGLIIAYIAGFVATILVGFDDPKEE